MEKAVRKNYDNLTFYDFIFLYNKNNKKLIEFEYIHIVYYSFYDYLQFYAQTRFLISQDLP